VLLDNLRKGAARLLGMILMGLLVVSFAIWGIADIFRGYGAQTLIKVGDTITAVMSEAIAVAVEPAN